MKLTSTPADVGMSQERLDRIHDWAAGYVDSGMLPCAMTAVMRHGQLVYVDTQGYQDVESKTPITTDTLFRIFSMTKPITTVAAMMLYEQAKFQLDDPVSKYIPEFKNLQVWKSGTGDDFATEPAASEITIQQIMTHTSGLTYAFMDPDSPLNDIYATKDLDFNAKGSRLSQWIGDVASVPLAFHPGTQWNYGISTDVLGHLVEIISGEPLDTFFENHILKPLGMHDTGFSVADKDAERFASAYKYKTGNRISRMEAAEDSQFRGDITRFQGGGGLISTASDYLRFQTMLLNSGELDGTRILGSKTVEFMTSNHMPGDLASMGQPKFGEVSFSGVGFGLGFAVMLDPAKAQQMSSVGEYNWGGAASTAFWNDPMEDISVVFLTQLYPSDTYPLRREVRTLVNQAVLD
jgi:CubicO group peptidase (beta-lactamase class C family)